MRFSSNRSIYYIGAILIINQIASLSSEEIKRQNHDTVLSKYDQAPDDGGGSGSRILSRKRRFLKFPEGSSFQVVYDQTIPIIGNTRLFTVGITIAMAWQLPSVSIFEISKMLQEKTAQGSLRRKDGDINATILVDTSTSKYDKSNKHAYYYDNPYDTQPSGYYNNLLHQPSPAQMGYSNSINYYTRGNYSNYVPQGQQHAQKPGFSFENLPSNFLSPYNWTRNDWSSLFARYMQTWVRNHPPNYNHSKRRFYPVFGKRSIDEHTHPEDKFFLNHHRSTRHDLYLQIEKFLEAKGKHGHHCVLRALCESGQRKNHTEPEPFLKEILKAVFSMPTTHEASTVHKHRMYDEAHGHVGDCAEKFSFCKDSIWSDDFIF
ncbi:uncharacterized protein LOC135701927 [Ochlerotatus camptorhynchus]|uniref:uncharacterized protein LOC135701927 n=1 Tax=Ochlerotatus camptorhynchus TaxID=644619 RepID=UPI0031D43976